MKQIKKIFPKIFSNSWIIFFSSLAWFLARTGTKPTRALYPCQQVARTNISAFGLPAIFLFWQRFKKCPRYRKRMIFGVLALILFFSSATLTWKKIQSFKVSLLPKAIGAGVSKVVWVTDNDATNGWAGDSSKVNGSVVQAMMDEAIMGLTGVNSVATAWQQILPCGTNCSDKKIAIKVNFNNQYCTSQHCHSYQTVNAVLDHLVNHVGISQGNINVYDAARNLPSYFTNGIQSRFSGVKLNDGKTPSGQCVANYSQACLAQALVNADYIINMPLLRTHVGPGVTLSLKNHFGSISNCASSNNCRGLHSGLYGSGDALVKLNNHAVVKGKTVLITSDALYGLKCGGPGTGNPDDSSCGINPGNNGDYPNSIFLSTDPIAVDSVMMDYLQSVGSTFNGKNPRQAYQAAANAGLGNYATSCNGSCSFNYSNIDLVRCPNGICPGGGTTPTTTLTATPPPGATFLEILSSWLTANFDQNSDGKVNGVDFGLILLSLKQV